MLTECPYCRQAEIERRVMTSVWTDAMARLASVIRVYMELSHGDNFSWRRLAQAMTDQDVLPVAEATDRACPYCMRGHVTRFAPVAAWPDLVVRCAGVARAYFEMRGSQRRFGWERIATYLLDGPEVVDEQWIPDVEIVEGDDPDAYTWVGQEAPK